MKFLAKLGLFLLLGTCGALFLWIVECFLCLFDSVASSTATGIPIIVALGSLPWATASRRQRLIVKDFTCGILCRDRVRVALSMDQGLRLLCVTLPSIVTEVHLTIFVKFLRSGWLGALPWPALAVARL